MTGGREVPAMAEFTDILYEVGAGAATITINRPERRNSLTAHSYREIGRALELANSDASVGAIVLTGAGERAFASGEDLKVANTLEPEEYRQYLNANVAARTRMFSLDKPVISRINGACVGGAMSLACTADLIVAVEEARFGQTEINVGMVGGIDHFWTVGRARLAEIMLLGRVFTAQEALQLGLVNMVVPRAELDGAVRGMVEEILAKSPQSIAKTKRMLAFVHQAAGWTSARAFQFEMVLEAFESEDRREGMSAFIEKRRPEYGRGTS
jgi:enoyl-CoA hydratase/carnithine racemase